MVTEKVETMDTLIRDWEGEYVVSRFDRKTGTMMFIAIHSTALGVASGGTRLKSYAHPREALRDAMRLAHGMTHKFAVIDFPRGGAKAVLSVPDDFDPADREGLMLRYGQWLADLRGVFETGPDLGTSPADMALIARHFSGVFGLPADAGGAGDSGPDTALGVFCGIQASCEHYFSSADLTGRTVLVQGAGAVGEPLIRLLMEAGCEVKFSDIDPVLVAKVRQELGLQFVEPEAVYGEPCDVFAPCAAGGILNAETIPQLACHIVAGSANNQLDEPEDGERLSQRNVLYAPDYVINAGGAIFLLAVEGSGWAVTRARERVRKIGDTMREIYAHSEEHGISPARAAERIAIERLRRGLSAEQQNK
jgi:leucine dehydrogenase